MFDARISPRLAPDCIVRVLDHLARTPDRLLCAPVRTDLEVTPSGWAGFNLFRVQLDLG